MKSIISLAVVLALMAFNVPTLAQTSIEKRLANMERRIQYLEQRIAGQDKVIVEKERDGSGFALNPGYINDIGDQVMPNSTFGPRHTRPSDE